MGDLFRYVELVCFEIFVFVFYFLGCLFDWFGLMFVLGFFLFWFF